jgi:hypothetical protein
MNSDYRDLIAEFNAHSVEYIVVGAHALAAHGHVRATKDLDVWIRPRLDNAQRVLTALRAFGAALHDLTVEDLASPGVIFQIGVEPMRIDVSTAIDGVLFDDAWPRRLQTTFADQPASAVAQRPDQEQIHRSAAARRRRRRMARDASATGEGLSVTVQPGG